MIKIKDLPLEDKLKIPISKLPLPSDTKKVFSAYKNLGGILKIIVVFPMQMGQQDTILLIYGICLTLYFSMT